MVLLDALTETDAAALLGLLAPGGDVDPGVLERILAVAEGNPLFIEQLLTAALEGDDEVVPDSIQTLLAARLDRLDDRDRAVAQAAAVCGTSFTTEDVAELVGDDPSMALLTLVRREFIRPGEADDPAGSGWSFRHSLIRDVAYGSLTKRARAGLHERLARRAVERDRDPDLTAGHHLGEAVRARRDAGERGAEVDRLAERAAEHLVRAGLAVHERHELAAAASLLGRANALRPRESPERVGLAPKLAGALVSRGEVAAARDLLADASAVASELGDSHLSAAVTIGGDLTLLWTDAALPAERILAHIDHAVPLLERAGDYESLALSAILRFEALDRAGSLTEMGLLSRALEYARRASSRYLEDQILGWICITLHRGTVPVDEAIARAKGILESSTSAYVRASAIGAMGVLRAMSGEFDEARALVADVAGMLDELGLRQAAAAHSIAVAEVEALAGDDAAAERILRDGLAAVAAVGDEHSTRNVAWRLGLALARQERYDDAEHFVTLAQKEHHRSFWVEVWWRVVLARVEAHRGDRPRVRQLVDEARQRMAAVEESGMHADALLESAEALHGAGLDDAVALVSESAAIAGRLGYVVAARRADDAQRALTA